MGLIQLPQPKQRPEWFTLDPLAPMARGLVFAGLGGLHGGVTYPDHSLHRNHGTLTNMDPATDWVWSQKLGRWGLDFDGDDDFVTTNQLTWDLVNFTASCWVNYRSIGSVFDGVIGNVFNNATSEWFVALGSSGAFRAYINDGRWHIVTADAARAANMWHHVTVRMQQGTWRFFVNGAIQSGSYSSSLTGTIDKGLQLGRYMSYYADALIADPLIHNRALTPAEIRQLADPRNVMLSGLIHAPGRRFWPVGGAATAQDFPFRRYYMGMAG